MARSASRHIEPRFSVPSVSNYTGKPEPGTHETNLTDYVERINEQIEAFGKARGSYRIEQTLQQAKELDTEARAYAKFFNLKLPKLPKLPVLDVEKLRTIKERESAAANKRETKRKAEQAAYEAKHAAEVKAWQDAGGCPHMVQAARDVLQPAHSYYDRYNCEQQTRRDEWEANKPALIAAWRNGTGKSNSLQFSYSDYALLRVKFDEKTGLHNVETSQGVSVPVVGRAGAARLLVFLQACKDAGRTYKANGHTEHIGNFTVSSFGPIDPAAYHPIADGEWILVAGCHRVLWSEIRSIEDAVRTANDADASLTINTDNVSA
jgi:hypothetical protein